jgi:hypothetical protein
MSPPFPSAAAPLLTASLPLEPDDVVPDLKVKVPVAPLVPEFTVCTTIDPDEVSTPCPLERDTKPPVNGKLIPLEISTSPPISVELSPTKKRTSPPLPLVAAPVVNAILPLAPVLVVPLVNDR